mgnify:CR=1 FL=1
MSTFPAVIEYEGSIWSLRFPDFDEAFVAGTIGQDNPLQAGRFALYETICFRLKSGLAVPAPSAVQDGQLTIHLGDLLVGDYGDLTRKILALHAGSAGTAGTPG